MIVATFAALAFALPTAAAEAKTCSVKGKERKLGPTYTLKLSVSGTSCSTGEKVVKGYYKCRKANGGADGKCKKKVEGYTCTEKRKNVVPTQFDASVTCKSGSKKVTHSYTQFT